MTNESQTKSDHPIESLLNLGPKSSEWLRDAGITTIDDLKRLGPVLAYRIVKQRQPKVSLNLLLALAAGLKDKHWRRLTNIEKAHLRRSAEQ
jgi:DNA transformation protein and related proteins